MIKINKKFYYPSSTRKIIDGKRHYLVGEEKLPSVTSILSACQSEEKRASLEAWKNRGGEKEEDPKTLLKNLQNTPKTTPQKGHQNLPNNTLLILE